MPLKACPVLLATVARVTTTVVTAVLALLVLVVASVPALAVVVAATARPHLLQRLPRHDLTHFCTNPFSPDLDYGPSSQQS